MENKYWFILAIIGVGVGGCFDEEMCCLNNDNCVYPEASCWTLGKCAQCIGVEPLQITAVTWDEAIVGQENFQIDLVTTGGIPPYTYQLTRGDETKLAWLTITWEGDNNEKVTLKNNGKYPTEPSSGDGILLTIVVKDSSLHGSENRINNQGYPFEKKLKINKCTSECNPINGSTCKNNTLMTCEERSKNCFWLHYQQCDGQGCNIDGKTCLNCPEGWGNCDFNPINGCETNLITDNSNCGACDTTCVSGIYCINKVCTTLTPGITLTHTIGDVAFNMKYVPGGTFPTGINNSGTATTDAFLMGETEVTYDLWYAVYCKATANGYLFANKGREGRNGADGAVPITTGQHAQPVTYINWRDAMVWCNLASELVGLKPAYQNNGEIVKNSLDANADKCDAVTLDVSANGFRLPSSMEWECAARYRNGILWTPGNYASGAKNDYRDVVATAAVAWYSPGAEGYTHDVATKTPNDLGIYDMSGNVTEWCFDWHTEYVGSQRVLRGGSWYDYSTESIFFLQVGALFQLPPYNEDQLIGFRLSRTK